MYVEASDLTEMSVPLDHISAARQRLSFIWCSILAAVSVVVILQFFIAVFHRVTSRPRHLFQASPTVDMQSPAAGDTGCANTGCDCVPVTEDRTAVGTERHGHRHRVSHSHQPPLIADRPSSPYVSRDRARRLMFPTTTATASTQLMSPKTTHQSMMHIESIYSIVESNV